MSDPVVLHVVPAFFGGPDGIVGGAERYALELARHMAEKVPTGLLTFGDRTRTETIGRLTVHVVGDPWYVRGQRTNPVSFEIVRAVRHAEIVHCHQQHVLGSTVAAMTARLCRRRVFVSELGGGGWDISAYVSTDRLYHGHLHLSEYSRQVYGHAAFPRAHVIYGGVDLARFAPVAGTPRGCRIVYVGRILPHKGVDRLIETLPDGLELDVIGQAYDARYLDDLRALAADRPVRFRHDVTDEGLVEAYRTALCVALPSRYTDRYGNVTRVPELLGQTLLEGMACGTPALATDVASLPEIVTDGSDGFVVDPDDVDLLRTRLTWLRDHPAEADALGRTARATVEQRFSWPTVVERCLAIYGLDGVHRG